MGRSFLVLSALSLVLLACGDRAPEADAATAEPLVSPEIFAGLPVMPGSRLGGRSSNAAEAVVMVPVTADSVARFYRKVLVDRSWDVRGDMTAPDGQVTLHARSLEGRPIWIMIQPAGPQRAEVSVIAAAVDSAARR